MPMKVVYECKPTKDGHIEKFKCRIVVKGCCQHAGRDFDPNQVYAPVTNMTSFKMLISMAKALDLVIFGSDVKGAFLNGRLDRTMYGRLGDRYFRIIMSLYGLRQAAYMWNEELHHELVERHGMLQSKADPCFYYRHDPDGESIFLVVWVDDIIGCSTSTDIRDDFIRDFSYEFGSVQRHLTWALKIEIEELESAISLRQRSYIDSMAEKFNASDMRPYHTPMEIGAPFTKAQCPQPGSEEHAHMA